MEDKKWQKNRQIKWKQINQQNQLRKVKSSAILKLTLNGEIIIRYTGNNIQNNNVFVDFKNKKVSFEPVSKASITKLYILNCITIFGAFLPVYFFTFCLFLMIQNSQYDKIFFSIAAAPVLVFTPMIIALQMFNKQWTDNYYAKFIAGMAAIVNANNFNFGFFIGKKITPKQLLGNVYIVPKFSNVAMKYKLVGDFADNIESINIKCLDDKGYRFFAVFTFKTPVNSGYMKLNYI